MRGLLIGLLCSVVVTFASAASGAEWEMRFNTDRGDTGATVSILRHGTQLVNSEYNFWGANWNYSGTSWKYEQLRGPRKEFTGLVGELGIELDATAEQPAQNQFRVAYQVSSDKELTGIIGGGLQWNLDLDSPALPEGAGEPELLGDDRGWRWPMGGGREIRVEFGPAADRVYFERGNKDTIRTMLVGKSFPAGSRSYAMTVTLPEGGAMVKSPAMRYAPEDTENWYSAALPHDAAPVDLSFLNHKPAGKHGFVQPRGDELVFEDGTPVRFWSGNIAAYAIYAEKENIKVQARRMAQLGYNMMRFHHHDSTRWVGNTVIDQDRDDSQHLDPDVMDRLDYWIKCLKDEGIYVWLDLHVGREFKTGDEIPGFESDMDDDSDGKAEGKGFCYYNDRIEELMQQFNEKYLSHVNKYTGVAYRDEPAIMGLLITNENDLTGHFGNRMLPDKNNPFHNKIFEAAVDRFAEKHSLDRQATWSTWLPGPSKLFLANREHNWNVRMLEHLEQIGVKVPVATTHMWGGNPMFSLPPLTDGSIVDIHSYGKAEALSVNPRYDSSYIHYAATGQAYGKPMAISEWNVPYPRTDRFTAPLYMASIAALQGWDAPMIYNYSQRTFGKPSRPRTWSTFPDVAITGIMPAAALAYRRGDVSPAQKTYCLQFSRKNLYMQGTHPSNAAGIRTLVEQSKLTFGLPDTPELDWDGKPELASDVEVVTEVDRDFIPSGRNVVTSDTGEIARNWMEGYQTIDTDRTQAAQGWIGGQQLEMGEVTFNITTPKAAVAVSSLDGEPIRRSGRLLISAVARAVASPNGRMPLLSEPVAGTLTIEAREGLQLIPLDGDGTELPTIDVERRGGSYTIELPAERGTHWFLLK